MRNKLFALTSLFVMSFTTLLAQEEGPMPPRGQGIWQTVALIAIALLFFYFILWRPEQKRRKDMEKQRDSVTKGDTVTAMGIIGKVVRVGEHTIIVSMYDGSKIEFLKAAITDVTPSGEARSESDKE